MPTKLRVVVKAGSSLLRGPDALAKLEAWGFQKQATETTREYLRRLVNLQGGMGLAVLVEPAGVRTWKSVYKKTLQRWGVSRDTVVRAAQERRSSAGWLPELIHARNELPRDSISQVPTYEQRVVPRDQALPTATQARQLGRLGLAETVVPDNYDYNDF